MYKCIVIVFLMVGTGLTQPPPPAQKSGALSDSSHYYVQQIITSTIPVLIDFWAVWCGPCRIVGPIIDEIQKEYRGKVKVIKINVDRNRSLSGYFKVMSIPSVYIVKDKVVVKNLVGVQPKGAYTAALAEVLIPVKSSN
jgi:thioredoxin 1